jgi:hypothetical protein
MQQRDNLLSAARLKKDIQSKKSRRTRTWIDKLRKGKCRNPKSAIPKKESKDISYACYSSLYVVVKNCLTNLLTSHWQKQKKNNTLQPQVKVMDAS